MTHPTNQLSWHKVLGSAKELPEGRVTTVTAGHTNVCLTHFKGKFCGLDNRCPHQGGPLGEGSIENGLLRCPWHGWDFDPHTGQSPGGHDDSIVIFPVEIREDGVYVGVEEEETHEKNGCRHHGGNYDKMGRGHSFWYGWSFQSRAG